MLRWFVMQIYSFSGVKPDKVMMILIIVGSVIIGEILYVIYKKVNKAIKGKGSK